MPLSQTAALCLQFSFASALATAGAGALCAQAGWRPWHLHFWLVSRPAWRTRVQDRLATRRALIAAEACALIALLSVVLAPAVLLVAWAALLFARVTPPQYGACAARAITGPAGSLPRAARQRRGPACVAVCESAAASGRAGPAAHCAQR
jgi:hypothetical protein